MNAKPLVVLVAATLFSVSSYAHDCSGGPSGGMDATGNQCNDSALVAVVDSTDGMTAMAPKAAPATTVPASHFATTSLAKPAKKASHQHTSLNRSKRS